MNTEQYEFAQMVRHLVGDGKVQGYEFRGPNGHFNILVEHCKYSDGVPWDPLGLHLGFTVQRLKPEWALSSQGPNHWKPIPQKYQPVPPPPKPEYEEVIINGVSYQFEKDAHLEWQPAIQMEQLKLLREIRDLLKDHKLLLKDIRDHHNRFSAEANYHG